MSIGIEIDPQFPGKTYETVAWLVKYVCEKTGIPLNEDRIVGHRKFVATTCPGTLDINKVIALANGSVVSEMIDPTKDLPASFEDKFNLKNKDWYNKYWTLNEMMEFLLKALENYEEPNPSNPKMALSDDIPTLIEETYGLKDKTWYNKYWSLEDFIKYTVSLGQGEVAYRAFLNYANAKLTKTDPSNPLSLEEEESNLQFNIDAAVAIMDSNVTKDISAFSDTEINNEFISRIFNKIKGKFGIKSSS